VKLIYRCHGCGLTAEVDTVQDDWPPGGWSYNEHLDGKHYWLCEQCT